MRIIQIKKLNADHSLPLPLYFSTVQAGFPSPAEDYIEQHLDLNDLMIQHPEASFYVRVDGESMIDANIHSGDILVVDRSKKVSNGNIVVAVLNGEFLVKRYIVKCHEIYLKPENPKYPTIKVQDMEDFQVWGVVTYVIHKTH